MVTMADGATELFKTRYCEIAKKHLCPQCHGEMAEVERVNENGFSFIWYECMRVDCDGQWLEKKAVNAA
jgi:hypothetical protein